MIFDLDGVLVDSEPLWHQAERAVFARWGIHLSVAQCRSTKGRYLGEVVRHWLAVFDRVDLDPDQLADEVVEAMAGLLVGQGTLKPGVHAALAACQAAGWPLAVASSSPRRLIEAALAPHGLIEPFVALVSAEELPEGKPDPGVYLAAARALEVAPSRCLAVEDSPIGVAAAKGAGMTCVAVPEAEEGHRGPEDLGWSPAPDLVLSSLEELAACLRRRGRGLRAVAGDQGGGAGCEASC